LNPSTGMLSAIIGMTVRNQLESLSAFNRNDCPLSSESATHMTISENLSKLQFTDKEVAGAAGLGMNPTQLLHGIVHQLHDVRSHLRQLEKAIRVGDAASANAAAVQKLVAGL
jgi:hypothetical protein